MQLLFTQSDTGSWCVENEAKESFLIIPVLPPHKAMRSVPTTVQIYQYDATPAAGRQPLLLVHGLKNEYVPSFHWQKVCEYLTSDETFQKRYKIYLARYNTMAPEKQVEAAFKPALRNLAAADGHPLVIVALSLSGSVIRNAMADQSTNTSVSRMITLGTPFHGSPIFSKDWLMYSSLLHRTWPTRVSRYIGYKVYFKHHPNLLLDYYWDNCDGQIPSLGPYRFRLPFLVHGTLLPPETAPSGASCLQSGEKIIAYAGYFRNSAAQTSRHTKLFAVLHAPLYFVDTTIPAFFGNPRAVLRFLNCEMAMMVKKDKNNQMAYTFNDGISPIMSTLSLTHSSARDVQSWNENDFETLKFKLDVKRARLFPNIDHLAYLEGGSPPGRTNKLSDQLSPEERPRPLFAWLLKDILN